MRQVVPRQAVACRGERQRAVASDAARRGEPQRAAASAGQATANRGEPRGAAAIGGGLLRAAVVSCGEGTRVRARGRKQLTAGTSLHMRRDDSALPFLHLKAKQGDVQKVKPSRGVFRTCIELQREQSKQNKALA